MRHIVRLGGLPAALIAGEPPPSARSRKGGFTRAGALVRSGDRPLVPGGRRRGRRSGLDGDILLGDVHLHDLPSHPAGYVDSGYADVAAKGYQGVPASISIDADGLSYLRDICVGTSVSDSLSYYFGPDPGEQRPARPRGILDHERTKRSGQVPPENIKDY